MDPRREQLDAWRKTKGRTPMKRMSLVQEFHKPSPIGHGSTSHRSVSRQTKRGGGGGSVRKDGQRVVQSSRTPQTHTSDQSTKKLTRRELLDQWLAVHGRTVKRPRSVLQPLNHVLSCTEVKPARPFTSVRGFPHSPHTLRRLKEQLQREIDEDCQDMELSECGEDDIAKQLNYSRELDCTNCPISTPTASHKVRTRHSLAADPTLIFPSSTIRYSFSHLEPRRRKHKRRHTMSSTFGEKRTVYLTPVRRSTRESRGYYTGDECIDSPSQLTNCDITVEIMPNKALEFDN